MLKQFQPQVKACPYIHATALYNEPLNTHIQLHVHICSHTGWSVDFNSDMVARASGCQSRGWGGGGGGGVGGQYF